MAQMKVVSLLAIVTALPACKQGSEERPAAESKVAAQTSRSSLSVAPAPKIAPIPVATGSELHRLVAWAEEAAARLRAGNVSGVVGTAKPSCYPDDDPTASARGMCQAYVPHGDSSYMVNWITKDPGAFKLAGFAGDRVRCKDIGREEASRKRIGELVRIQCGPIAGVRVAIDRAKAGQPQIAFFSAEYLKHDPNLEQ